MPWLVGEGETATQRAANGGARETPVSTWRRAGQGHAGDVRAGREDGQGAARTAGVVGHQVGAGGLVDALGGLRVD